MELELAHFGFRAKYKTITRLETVTSNATASTLSLELSISTKKKSQEWFSFFLTEPRLQINFFLQALRTEFSRPTNRSHGRHSTHRILFTLRLQTLFVSTAKQPTFDLCGGGGGGGASLRAADRG